MFSNSILEGLIINFQQSEMSYIIKLSIIITLKFNLNAQNPTIRKVYSS